MEIIELPIKSISPYKNNPRHNDKAVEFVANSLRQFGWKQPIVIDEKYEIVAGHTRWKAAKMLGMETVPCVMADDLTPEQVQAYRLADNKTAEMADWDFDLLEQELNDIDPAMFDMADFGFFADGEEPETEQKEIIEDEAPELDEVEPVFKRGQIWQLGDHRLMCGDSTSAEDVARLMNGEKADMVFTDPPYGVDYASKNKYLNAISRGNRIQVPIENDALASAEEEKEALWIPAFTNAFNNATDRCSYYVTSPQGGELMMMMAIRESGWLLKHTLIWNKNNHVLGRSDYNYKHEPILYGWKKQHDFYGKGKFKTSVWDIPKPQKSDLHPTMKPVELVAECEMNSTKEGDVILDLFGGSGTTLIASEQLCRICRMMEYDPHYCDVIIKRWDDFTGQKAVLLEE